MGFKLISIAATALVLSTSVNADVINISTYDVTNTALSGYGGWAHTYDGLIAGPTSTLYNYSGGSGTMNDGLIGNGTSDTHLLSNADDFTITLNLDGNSTIDSLSLFSFSNTNGIPGSIYSLDVTINGITENFETSGFGVSGNSYGNPHEYIDFTSSSLDGLLASAVILSNFTSVGVYSNFSAISEIQLEGAPATVPVPAAVWLFGSGLLGLIGVARRKKS